MTLVRIQRTGPDGLPTPPAEIADEVELWARQFGRHATLRFVPTIIKRGAAAAGTWTVRLSPRDSDKTLGLYQTGRIAEVPDEVVWLHEPDATVPGGYRPYDIMQLGAGGVRTFLDKGNMWSGRGQFSSLEEQRRMVNEANEQMRQKKYEAAKDGARSAARDKRRQFLKIPFVRVVADLIAPKPAAQGGSRS